LAAALSTTNYATAADNTFENQYYHNEDISVEPHLQLTLFPGIDRATNKPLVMHMVDSSNHSSNIFTLNSRLAGSANSINTKKYFDDIEITNNNIFELKF
jgi:hypothetical protein